MALARAKGRSEACGEALGSRPSMHCKVHIEDGIPDLADIEIRCTPCNTGKRDDDEGRQRGTLKSDPGENPHGTARPVGGFQP